MQNKIILRKQLLEKLLKEVDIMEIIETPKLDVLLDLNDKIPLVKKKFSKIEIAGKELPIDTKYVDLEIKLDYKYNFHCQYNFKVVGSLYKLLGLREEDLKKTGKKVEDLEAYIKALYTKPKVLIVNPYNDFIYLEKSTYEYIEHRLGLSLGLHKTNDNYMNLSNTGSLIVNFNEFNIEIKGRKHRLCVPSGKVLIYKRPAGYLQLPGYEFVVIPSSVLSNYNQFKDLYKKEFHTEEIKKFYNDYVYESIDIPDEFMKFKKNEDRGIFKFKYDLFTPDDLAKPDGCNPLNAIEYSDIIEYYRVNRKNWW